MQISEEDPENITKVSWVQMLQHHDCADSVHQRVEKLNVHPTKENPAEEFSQRWLIKPGKVKNSPKKMMFCFFSQQE